MKVNCLVCGIECLGHNTYYCSNQNCNSEFANSFIQVDNQSVIGWGKHFNYFYLLSLSYPQNNEFFNVNSKMPTTALYDFGNLKTKNTFIVGQLKPIIVIEEYFEPSKNEEVFKRLKNLSTYS